MISRLFYILARNSGDGELGSFVVAVIIAGVIQGIIMYIGTRSSLYRSKVFSFMTSLYMLFFAVHTAVIASRIACDMYYNGTGLFIYVALILVVGWCCAYFGITAVLRACTMMLGGLVFAIVGLMVGAAHEIWLMPANISLEFSAMGITESTLEILSFATEVVLINELMYHTAKPSGKGIAIFTATSVVAQLLVVLLVAYTLGGYAGFSNSPVLSLSRVLGGVGKADAEAVYLATWLLTATLRASLMLVLASSAGERVSRGAYMVMIPATVVFALAIAMFSYESIVWIALMLMLTVGIAIPILGLFTAKRYN